MERTTTLNAPKVTRQERSQLPFEEVLAAPQRERRRSRQAPWFLMPLLAILTGIGVSYVGEHATATQDSYVLAGLSQTNSTLENQNATLAAQLAQLESTERIVNFAQKLGMVPAEQWSYAGANSSLESISSTAKQEAALSSKNNTVLQQSQLHT